MWRFDRFGDAVALLDEHGQSLTYAQLAREGEALCGAIGGRCLCFNLCGNTLGSAVGYAGMVEMARQLALTIESPVWPAVRKAAPWARDTSVGVPVAARKAEMLHG